MSVEQESELWRQRYFEAQAGMERFLAERYGNQEIARWLSVRSEILDGLNRGQPPMQEVGSWKSRFFRAQALLEKYLAEHHSLEDIDGWTKAIGEVFKHTEPDRGGGAGDLAIRLAKQAQCYGSEFEIEQLSRDYAKLRLHHCAIWDYREEARRLGVPLTLKSPCTFCTKATIANIEAKGCSAEYELYEHGTDHGCVWEIRRRAT
jgi:hypothetical protein